MTTAHQKALKKYRDKLIKKQITFNPDKDSDLIAAMDNDKQPLNSLVKRLLREYYSLKDQEI